MNEAKRERKKPKSKPISNVLALVWLFIAAAAAVVVVVVVLRSAD